LAGTEQDLQTAKDVLSSFNREFNIPAPKKLPIFEAGSPESRSATLDMINRAEPYAWIDTYHTFLNYPINSSLEILGGDGDVVWTADLNEHGNHQLHLSQ
jgi:N-acetylated-alpha-linked acidic dipeptidase